MRNYLDDGDTIPIASMPEAADSGEFLIVGELMGVAVAAFDSGAAGTLKRTGVFWLPKTTSEAWTQGQKLFWNSSTKKFTTDSSKTPVSAIAWVAADSADTEGKVLLAGPQMKFASGVVALDGSAATPTVTGLTAVIGGGAWIKKTTSPGVGTSVLTVNPNGTSLDIYPWKVTATNDATLVASTGTEDVEWIAWGY